MPLRLKFPFCILRFAENFRRLGFPFRIALSRIAPELNDCMGGLIPKILREWPSEFPRKFILKSFKTGFGIPDVAASPESFPEIFP